MAPLLRERLARRLVEVRHGAGFGPTPGASPEPEPTALAAIALDDGEARDWLVADQREDGGFGLVAGTVNSDAPTSVASLALLPGEARERALDYLVGHREERFPFNEILPHDPDTRGWGWTRNTFGWVEPTARAVLALRLFRPGASSEIGDGLTVIADRECLEGGWNFGNSIVYGEPLPAYAQTTAMALIAIQGTLPDLAARGLQVLGGLWSREPGGLSLALSLAAFRLADRPEVDVVERTLEREFDATGLEDDVVSLAWATIATGDGLETIRWRGP